jgi:hypothetical protein
MTTIKWRKVRCAGYVAHVEELRNVYTIVLQISAGKKPL